MRRFYASILLLTLMYTGSLFAQTFIAEPPKGYTSNKPTPVIKLFYSPSDSIVLNWSKSLSSNARLRIGTQPGNYGLATLPVSGKRAAFKAGDAPLNLTTGRYYAILTNSGSTTLSGIQNEFNGNPGTIDYSNELQFVVESNTAPTPTGPRGSTTDATPLFQWNAIPGVPAYWIICSSTPFVVRSDSNGNPSVQGANIVWDYLTTGVSARYGQISPASPFTQTAIPLFPGNTYYYTLLNVYDQNNVSYASTTFGGVTNFTYSATSTIAAPNLVAPTANQIFSADRTIRFQWDAVSGANGYTVFLFNRVTQFAGSNQEIDLPVWNSTVTSTQIDFPARTNLLKGKYAWFVIPNSTTGSGNASATRQFTYQVPTGRFRVQAVSSLDNTNLINFQVQVSSTTGGYSPSVPYIVSNTQSLADSLPSDVYRFTGSKPGYYDTTITVTVGTSDANVTLVLRPLPATVSGAVTDQANEAINNASVKFTNQVNGEVKSTSTSSTGAFSINLPKGLFTVEASKDGYLPATRANISIDTGQVILSPALKITQDNASISGKVLNDNGEPVQLATVKATKGTTVLTTSSNGTGNYSFTLTSGTWVIECTKSGFISPAPVSVALLTAENKQNQNLVLTPRANQVTGFVYQVISTSGQNSQVPFADVTVTATPTNGQTVTAVTTQNGQYTLSLRGGSYTITAAKNGYTAGGSTQLTLTIAQTISDVNFTLTPNPCTVTGVVAEPNAAPVPGAVVAVAGVSSATSLSSGSYTLSLPAGTYTLGATKTGYITPASRTLTLTPGQTLSGINFQMSPNASVISGKVSSLGQPLPQATVTATAGTQLFTVTTNAAGEYLLSLVPGSWNIQAAKQGFITSGVVSVTAGPGQASSNNDFSLTQNTARIQGTVLSSNLPLGAATVTLRDSANPATVYSTITNIGGEFATTVEAGKKYLVSVTKAGYSTYSQTTQVLAAGGTLVINAGITANPASVSGRIKSNTLTPLTGAVVTLVGAGGAAADQTSSDNNGNYTLGSNPDAYTVRVALPGYTRDSIAVTLTAGQTLTDNNFTLTENFGLISGVVKDNNGAALGGALVNLSSAAGSASYVTGNDGAFTATRLVGSTYAIRIAKDGYSDSTVAGFVLNDGQNRTVVAGLRKLSGKISGTVKTSGGQNVADASVFATDAQNNIFTAVTDASGVYEITSLNTGTYTVKASKAGFRSAQLVPVTLTTSALNGTAAISDLAQNRSKIFGTVKDAAGTAVFDAVVNVSGVSGSGNNNTTSNGAYAVSGLAPGTYTVTVTKQGFSGTPQNVTVTDSSLLDLTMSANNSRITGTVKNQQGSALGFTAAVKAVSARNSYSTTADASGNFTIADVANGTTYTVFTEIFREGFVNDSDVVNIAAGASSGSPVALQVTVNSASISGNAGTPNAVLKIARTATGQLFTASSGSDGTYALNFLADGAYTVTPEKAGFAFSPASTPLTLGVGQAASATFTATANTGTVKITAKTSANEAIADASVSLVSADNSTVLTKNTNSAGEAVFTDIRATSYTARISKTGYGSTPAQATVALTNGANLTQAFTMALNSSSVSGNARRKIGTNTFNLSDATITLRNTGSGQLLSTTSRADGTFRFDNAAAGSYVLVGAKSGFKGDTLRFALATGENKAGADVTLPQASAAVTGKVVNSTGPVANATITASSSSVFTVLTNSLGVFDFPTLPVSPNTGDTTVYDLRVSGEGIVGESQILKIPATEVGNTVTVPQFLLPSGRVRLTVTDGGNTLPGVVVNFSKPDGSTEEAVTGTNGLFNSSSNLAAGNYRVSLRKSGYLIPDANALVVSLPTDTAQVNRTLQLRFRLDTLSSVIPDSAAVIRVPVNGSTAGLAGKVFYKRASATDYSEAALSLNGSVLTGAIPALFSLEELRYYTSVTEGSPGVTARSDEFSIVPEAKGVLSAASFTPALNDVTIRKNDSYEISLNLRDGKNTSLNEQFSAPGTGSVIWEVSDSSVLSVTYPKSGDNTVITLTGNKNGSYRLTATAKLRGVTVKQTALISINDVPLKQLSITAPVTRLSNKSRGIQLGYSGLDTTSKAVTLGGSLQWTISPAAAGTISKSGFFTPADSTFIGYVKFTAKDSLGGKAGSVELPLVAEIRPNSDITLTNKEGMSLRIQPNSVPKPIEVTLDLPRFGPGKKYYQSVGVPSTYVVSDKQYFIVYNADFGLKGDSLLRPATLELPIDNSLKFFEGANTLGYYDYNTNDWNLLSSTGSADGRSLNSSSVYKFGEYSILTENEPLGLKKVAVMPSPFSPEVGPVKIGYFLTTNTPPASVTIRVFNLRGELVRTILQNDIQNPGRYGSRAGLKEITWDGKTDDGLLARNGRYIIQITATDPGGEVSELTQVVLVK